MTRSLSIQNRQRTRPVDTRLLRRITQALLQELSVLRYELGLQLVDAVEMAAINQNYLQHDGSTDVITFDYAENGSRDPLHGEIVISVPDALAQAREFRTSWQAEVTRYVVHGVLHLLGHDDLEAGARRIMKREEDKLTAHLCAAFSIAQLSRRKRRTRLVDRSARRSAAAKPALPPS